MNEAPEPQSHTRHLRALLALLILAVFVYSLFAFGIIRKRKPLIAPPPQKESRYEELLRTTPVSTVLGTITAIDGALTIDIPSLLGVSLPQNSSRRTKTALLGAETSFAERRNKSQAQFEEELKVYEQQKRVEPPAPYLFKSITRQDLKVGDVIIIEVDDGLDIKDIKTFPASHIIRVVY